ncbi:MAG TPA: endonuclease/exonuclease/phosphatase family protein [Polyangiaceae bacterium]|nr:endonuclease/exonuclease/phosphatase family protein [Polyangiaceae bacterium]
MEVRILSWNIHKGIGGLDRLYRLERVVETLQTLSPDICLLQEVADGWPGARRAMQVDELAAALDYPHVAFAPEHRFSEGGYGNAILSRYPLHDTVRIDLTVGWRKKRGALLARAVARKGEHQRTLVLGNMHLGLAGSERGLQLERFLACEPFRGVHHTTPVVLAGDLNDLWGSLGPRYLEPAGFLRAGHRVNTFPAYMPLRPLDGIFVRGEGIERSGAVGRAKYSAAASDHLPLVAKLVFG